MTTGLHRKLLGSFFFLVCRRDLFKCVDLEFLLEEFSLFLHHSVCRYNYGVAAMCVCIQLVCMWAISPSGVDERKGRGFLAGE